MKTLVFSGGSDDTFGEYGVTNDDYDNCASGKPIAYRVTDGSGAGLHVVGQYAPSRTAGCWCVGIAQLDEGVRLPQWPMRWGVSDRGYSVELEIDVPDDIAVVCLEGGR